MKKSGAKKFSILAMILIFAVSVTTVALGAFADNGGGRYFNAEYVKGQTVELTETTVGNVSAKPTLISPSGRSYTGDSAVLKEMGVYKAVFKNGNSVVKEETFKCISPICSVSGNAKVEYKANAKTPSVYGLNAELSDGSSFTYNKVLDLNSLSDKELIKLYVVPQTVGYCDFIQINFTLTDIYNPRNYVIINVNNVTDGYHNGTWDYEYSKYTAYMRAGTLLSTPSGIEHLGAEEKLHVGNTYGTSLICSFCGLGEGTLDKQTMSFVFDYAEKQIKTGGNLVIDLDDPNHFTDLWEGFTTGEAILSVSLSGYRSNSGTIVITEIGGAPVTSEATFYDEIPPVITVNYGEYGDKWSVPSGCINSGYKIFPATANDTYSGNLEVTTKVYYDYLGAKEEIIYSGDAFVPKKQGVYTIEYTCSDGCGNLATETCQIDIARSGKIINVSFAEDKITAAKAGIKVPIAQAVVTGGYGEKKIEYQVTAPDGSVCEINDGKILVIKSGNYTVKAQVTDYVGQTVSKTYTIAVTANDEPVFIDEVVTPRYFMNGYKYILPTLQAYMADGNRLTPIPTSIMIKDGGGKRTLNSNEYTPAIVVDGTDVTVTYAATINGKTVTDEHAAKGYVTKKGNGALSMDKFFIKTSGVSVTANDASISFTASAAGESAAFINPVLANSFSLMANFGEMGGAYEAEFLLEDSLNPEISAAVAIEKKSDGVYFKANGKENLLRTFDENVDYYLVFSNIYSRAGLKNKENGSTVYAQLSDTSIYFPSGKVYLTVKFKKISAGSATLLLKNLNEQNLKSMNADLLEPSIDLFADTIGRKYSIGDTVTVSKAVAADVLDPCVTLSVTVRDSYKNVVKDKTTGIDIKDVTADKNYSFDIADLRTYTVIYTAVYDDGEKVNYQYVVFVADTQKPTFVLEHKVAGRASVGGYVYVPKASGKDNIDDTTKVYYYIVAPDGIVRTFDREKYDGFKVQAKGNYIVRYVTYDATGNMALYDYVVVVD